MPRNIEIKARLDRLELWLQKAGSVADSGPTLIEQDDTFFHSANGRLKLRSFSTDAGELIFYQRADSAEPKESTYFIAPVSAPEAMREVLTRAYGQLGRIRKQRHLFLIYSWPAARASTWIAWRAWEISWNWKSSWRKANLPTPVSRSPITC